MDVIIGQIVYINATHYGKVNAHPATVTKITATGQFTVVTEKGLTIRFKKDGSEIGRDFYNAWQVFTSKDHYDAFVKKMNDQPTKRHIRNNLKSVSEMLVDRDDKAGMIKRLQVIIDMIEAW